MSLPVPGSSGRRAAHTGWAPAAAGSSQDAPAAEQGGRRGWWLPPPRAGGQRHLSANRLPGVFWLLPLGHPGTGGDGMFPCSAMCSVQGGSDLRHPQRPTRDPPLRPCARTPRGSREGMLQPTRAVGVELKGSETSPQAPGTCGGAAPIPSSSPLQDAVASTRTERAAPRAAPSPVVPLLADPGGGMAAAPAARPSQMAWAASTGGPEPRQIGAGCLRSARDTQGCVPATLRGPEQSQGPLTAQGGQSRRVPTMLCPVLDPALQHRHQSPAK